jgi:hypothetical protein
MALGGAILSLQNNDFLAAYVISFFVPSIYRSFGLWVSFVRLFLGFIMFSFVLSF